MLDGYVMLGILIDSNYWNLSLFTKINSVNRVKQGKMMVHNSKKKKGKMMVHNIALIDLYEKIGVQPVCK